MAASPPCRAFVHGAALCVSWQDAAASLPDLIFGCVKKALSDSGVEIEKIDSVVLSAHDLVDGRSLSSMVTAPAAGAYLRDEIRLAEDGLAAASLAAARIEAGETEFSIVAAWGRASEGNYSRTSRAAFDPFLMQPFGINEFDISAARLSKWIALHGTGDAIRRTALEARAARSERNPRAIPMHTRRPSVNFPLAHGEAPRLADVVVAAVLGRGETSVRVAGVGHSAESHHVGDRNLLAMHALKEAVDRARNSAGSAQWRPDIYELAGATLTDEALALEALALAGSGEGFATYAAGTSINPSGGGERGWCFPAMGLANLVECYFQLSGRAGAVQVSGAPKRALATGTSPMGGQVVHAMALQAA